MDDILVDDDPRKQSAKKIKIKQIQKASSRSLGQFLFDWVIKSLLLTIILAIDFTLFANAGSYSIFTPFNGISTEALWIYIGIGATSFIIMLLAMILLPLDNVILAAGIGAFVVALISQFALFDKNSLLLILAGDLFSDDVNVILYKYAPLLIGALVFLITYVILKVFSRSLLFYLTLAVAGVLGWVLSQAYFNPSKPVFYDIKQKVASMGDNIGNNLVFLSFSNLTSIDNLYNLYRRNPQNLLAQKSWQMALGFYANNNFKVYPNAVVARELDEIDSIRSFYNPETDKMKDATNVVLSGGYFDFKHLHLNNNYLAYSSLIDSLKNKGFGINVYQTDKIDICNNDKIDNCAEKINYPFVMQADKVPLVDRVVILAAQWLVSTGIVDSINPVLSVMKYVVDGVKPYPFQVDKLNVVNSFNVLDMIISDIEHNNGNQAYFAIVDLPADTFVYDEYCTLKGIREWADTNNSVLFPVTLGTRQKDYLEQNMCVYGYLNKFMQQLERIGIDENTTVVINGIGTPKFLGDVKENDFYRRMQSEQAVAMAIKSAKATNYAIDYSVCLSRNIVDTYFSGRKACQEFSFIKTTDKVIDNMRKSIKEGKISDNNVKEAMNKFNDWFVDWARLNNYTKVTSQPVIVPNQSASVGDIDVPEIGGSAVNDEIPLEVAEDNPQEDAIEEVVEEVLSESQPETLVEETVKEETAEKNEEGSAEVIPETLFDNGVSEDQKNEENTNENSENLSAAEEPTVTVADEQKSTEENTEEDKPANTEYNVSISDDLKLDIKTDAMNNDDVNPKQGYDLNQVINEAKRKANLSADEAKKEKDAAVKTAQDKVAAAKQQIEESKQNVKNSINNTKEVIKEVERKVEYKNLDLKDVLVAPQTNGQKLSPEELKKQYHEMLNKSATTKHSSVIKVVQ